MQVVTFRQQMISIHAPRGGSDLRALYRQRQERNFNPRSPWGERRGYVARIPNTKRFQSTLPVGGATMSKFLRHLLDLNFNPRSPWGERLYPRRQLGGDCQHFNPRSPWGERLTRSRHVPCSVEFQSTLPVGGATESLIKLCVDICISIHAPRVGSDCAKSGKYGR